jgi:hypothetical protein
MDQVSEVIHVPKHQGISKSILLGKETASVMFRHECRFSRTSVRKLCSQESRKAKAQSVRDASKICHVFHLLSKSVRG